MSQSLSVEAEHAIQSLPGNLVQASENFHTKCLQHLAKAHRKGKSGWDKKNLDLDDIKMDLNKATKEGDWTAVANYAMILNHHGATGAAPAEQTDRADWAQSMPAGAVLGIHG